MASPISWVILNPVKLTIKTNIYEDGASPKHGRATLPMKSAGQQFALKLKPSILQEASETGKKTTQPTELGSPRGTSAASLLRSVMGSLSGVNRYSRCISPGKFGHITESEESVKDYNHF